ncbi:Zinc finger protein 175 [Araneus ventricosus]|uniref:Zinc finger protein 175 n=1 Tax=Araneus ventricosus TaxID=182803 RepID=A0A4Y2URW8_ARAVE|nr:Zinc finger protein 175 [Araneus ventricosus]GBO15769.1 Zinc finger protein 175 [Araneus ventricosus]
MNTAARNRCPGIRSFIVCFYCNENFRSLSSLLKHCCSAEEKISLDWEPYGAVSDTNDVDLTQEDWEPHETISDLNDVDLSQEDWEPHETVSDTNDCDLGQDNSVSSESVSNVSNVCENSLPETECEQPTKSNTARQETIDLASDAPGKQLLEANVNVVRVEVTKLASDESEKQSSEANSGVIKEVTDLTSDASEKQSSEANSYVVKEVTDLASDASKKQLSVASSGAEQKIAEVDPNADDDFDRASPDLVSKVLQYYEKQTKQGTPDSCCKSSSTEMEFQSSRSPLPTVESGSPRHDNTQIECSATDICSKGLSSDTKCDTYGENIIQKESDALKPDAKGLDSHDSNMCSGPSSPEVDSSDMCSRSSSIGMDLDSLGCSADQAESNDSDVYSTLSLSNKKSNELKHDHVRAELHASEISGKSLPEENLNIIKHGSVILKPCYVKVHDIFKSLSNSKLSPKKIFSWKKKYHVCDVCYKFFRLRSDLNIHYLIHTCVKPYVCNICGKSFIKQCNLFAHHLAHTIKRHHVCSVCKKAFPKKSLLLRHKLTHTKEKPFACDKCNKSYSVKSSLNEHYLSHSDERPFICEICSASFNNKRYLRKHYYKHQRKENVCEFCFKVFKRKHHLDEHYNIHINDRPHECKICGKSFHLLLTLNKHYTVAHRNERDRIFQKNIKDLVDCIGGKDPVIQKIEKSTVFDEAEKTPVKKIEKSTVVNEGEKTPVKKIEKSAVVDKGEKAPVKKIGKSAVVDKGEKTAVKKIEKSSVDDKSKETVPYSTRRKSFTPRKYLQPGSFVLY